MNNFVDSRQKSFRLSVDDQIKFGVIKKDMCDTLKSYGLSGNLKEIEVLRNLMDMYIKQKGL